MGVRDSFSVLEPKVEIVQRREEEVGFENERQEDDLPNRARRNHPMDSEDYAQVLLEISYLDQYLDFTALYPFIWREFGINLNRMERTISFGFERIPRATLHGMGVQMDWRERIASLTQEWQQRRQQYREPPKAPEPAVHPVEEEPFDFWGMEKIPILWTPFPYSIVKQPSLYFLAHQVHLLFLMRGWF